MVQHLSAVADRSQEEGAAVQALMQTIRHGAVLLDQHGRVLAGNAPGYSMLRGAEDTLIGRLFTDIAEVRPATMFRDVMEAAWGGQEASVVARIRRTEVGHQEVLADMSLLRTDDGEGAYGILAQLTDLSAVRQRQEKDREYQRKQMQSEKMQALEQFAAGVAHELNNPLASVVGFSELLLLDGELTDDAQDQVRAIIDQGRRAATIIQKLSTFANPSPPDRERISPNDLVKAALELLDLELRTHHVRVELSLSPDLPNPIADSHQLVQALCAITTNAITAMYDANGAGVLRLATSSPRPGWVRITVRDDGPGIPRQVLSRIFDPFFTTRDVGRGPGIGLSMVYSLVKEHGGDVRALNNVGARGATLEFDLPVDDPYDEENIDTPPPPRILVADDDEAMLQLVKRALESRGYVITTASDGQQALDRMRDEEWDGIVLDLRMPRMNGEEVYGRILEERPRIAGRILFMTGDTAGSKAHEFLQAARVPHLYKPFSIRTVRAAVDELVQSHRGV